MGKFLDDYAGILLPLVQLGDEGGRLDLLGKEPVARLRELASVISPAENFQVMVFVLEQVNWRSLLPVKDHQKSVEGLKDWQFDVYDEVLPDAPEQEHVGKVGDGDVVSQGPERHSPLVHLHVV